MYPQPVSAEDEDKMKISSEQKADIVRRIQVKNPDGTWAVSYKALAPEFGVSSCLIYTFRDAWAVAFVLCFDAPTG